MDQEFITEEELLPIIRKQYIENPPDGYTADEIREMTSTQKILKTQLPKLDKYALLTR